jgi:hypothetical protein
MRILLATILCAVAASARAQDTSDLQPPPPQLPQGTFGYGAYQPGMPLPQFPSGAAQPGKKEPEARPGFYAEEPEGVGEAEAAPMVTGERPPDTHVVQKGETLWGLSATYFKNPWYWPKLWALNPSVTNPHWIYPGDVLRLAPPEAAAAPVAAATPPPVEPAPRGLIAPPRASASAGLFLRQTGFVEPGELAAAGRIVGSKEEKLMLSTLDEAYVEFNKKHPMQVGERYTVYRPIREVKHPVSGKTLGDLVQIFGDVEVKTVTDGGIARVVVIDSTEPMERGFRVGPLRRQFKMVAPKVDAKDLSGVVVTTLHPLELVGTETLVFVDRGKDDGVEIGNRFVVVRRGDGYRPILATGPVDDKRFPRETIAEILVIDLRDRLATGLVTRANKEARIGDRVEARRGF